MARFSPREKQSPLKKENEDYCFTEIPLNEELITGVKLLDGPFENVIYYYGHVKLVPEGDMHKLAFQYTVWDSANHSRELLNGKEFISYLGDVLVAIIADENKSGEYNDPARTDDSEESDIS